MAKTFNATYTTTSVLGEISNNRKVELGHYTDNETKKAYGEKIYITGSYTTKKGEEKSFVTATQLTINDLAELQKLDLSKFDTETNVAEAFD